MKKQKESYCWKPLQCQIPVLVRDIPIYEQWLEDGRHLYKGKTVEEMREKMIGILEGRLPDLTQAGYQVAKERDIAKNWTATESPI